MRIYMAFLSAFLLISFNRTVFAESFHPDSPRNKRALHLEFNNGILHVSAGVPGEPSLTGQFQKFVQDDLGMGESPKGWETQNLPNEPGAAIEYHP